MAIKYKHTCSSFPNDYLEVECTKGGNIKIVGLNQNKPVSFVFDIPTAIRFSKSVRTEINKAKEVKNA